MAGLLNIQMGNEPEPTQQDIEVEERKQQAINDALGSTLNRRFNVWKDAKREIEEEWLKDLRAFNGIYESNIRIGTEQSDVYVAITLVKCIAAYSRIVDLLFQSNDKHWSIDATPSPDLENGNIIKDPVTGQMIKLTAEQLSELAKMQVELMSDEMEDQLIEAHYDRKAKSAIMESCVIGSGALKGITTGVAVKQSWKQSDDDWDIQNEERPAPQMEQVSVFDLYQDPYADSVDDCIGMYQRHVLNRNQLRELKRDERFNAEVINDLLINTGQTGTHVEEHHEIERKSIAGLNNTTATESHRYDVLEYWGTVSGMELIGAGVDVDDESKDYHANVWVCGSRTLLAQINPAKKQRLPYQIFHYQRVIHQFWGISPARMMRDSQETLNASVRSLLDNMAISSAPQVEVNTNLLAAGEDPNDFKPWKVWKRDSGDPSVPMMRFYQPNSNVQPISSLIEMFRRFADEETALPSYTHGQQISGMNKTASGMSMLMGAANTSIKGIVKNIDDYMIRPLLESLYDWNMQWSDKHEIKGDMNVDARGATTLVAKEIQSQRLTQFAQMTANPIDVNYVNRPALLRSIAESMDINAKEIIKDDEEIQREQAIQQQASIEGGGIGSLPAENIEGMAASNPAPQ